jgi:hypothetical protein
MTAQTNSSRGPIDGVEIYAKKIINDGTISSDTYAKIVTDNYSGKGNTITEPSDVTKGGGIKGIFFEVGGNMQHDGMIQTDKDAVVDVKVRGNYTSNKGKIIQGEAVLNGWHTTWWGVAILTVVCGFLVASLVYIFDLNK